MSKGTLVLIPNTLDLGAEAVDLSEVLPHGALHRTAQLTHWVAEDARSARALLKRVNAIVPLAQPLQMLAIHELPRPRKGSRESVPDSQWEELLQPALQGHDIGLVSEAGLPAVADPGNELVRMAHRLGLAVLPLSGPSSLMMALSASGLNGQSFAFVGYLPQDGAARTARLRELESTSRRFNQTQLLIETPYRNAALLQAMLATLAPQTQLAIGCGLTLPGGWTRTDRIQAWKARPVEMPDRWPAVFSLLAD